MKAATVHATAEEAKAAITNPLHRVFRVEAADGRVGFIAARDAFKARSYAAAAWDLLKVAVAEKRRKTVEEQVAEMTPEQLARIRDILEKRLAAEQPAKRNGRKR